jgi:dihydroflavonol-4-reductase
MKILVTGATGFVGAVLLPGLIQKFGLNAVSAFILPGEQIPQSFAGRNIRIFYGDITDAGAVYGAVQGKSHVIHLAGLISYRRRDAGRLLSVNRDGVRNVVQACLRCKVLRLVHVSSVGAIGFNENGDRADETTPFNWHRNIHYLTSKYEGQKIVEEASCRGLNAVILNPASIMGPGDDNFRTAHNQLYQVIGRKRLFGSFAGGLAVVDVRDLAAIIIKALERGRTGEKYLIVGANITYPDVIRLISRASGRKAYPVPIPAPLVAAGGGLVEFFSRFTKKPPVLTHAYGKISGLRAYYANEKSRTEFAHSYIPVEQTIRDGWAYFDKTFPAGK